MNKDQIKNIYLWFVEKYLPFIFGIIGSIVIVYCSFIDEFSKQLEKILHSTITFSSITVGFVGALLGILFSIRNTEIMTLLFETKGKVILKKYFKKNIIAGIALVFISLILYVKNGIDKLFVIEIMAFKPSKILFAVWGFLLVYMLLSTYRITSIMMYIIFSDSKTKNKDLEPVKMDERSKDKLKRKYQK